MFNHCPVLLKEIVELLNPQPNDQIIDGTVGLGGHAKALLEKSGPNGRLLALDRDSRQIPLAQKNLAAFGDRVTFINDSYANLKRRAYDQGFDSPTAVLLDLGFRDRKSVV